MISQAIDRLIVALKGKPWCEWQVDQVNGSQVVISGGWSRSEQARISLVLRGVDMFSGSLDWMTESDDVAIASGELESEISSKFRVQYPSSILVFVDRSREGRLVCVSFQSLEVTGEWCAPVVT
jgi:hypothetical protein